MRIKCRLGIHEWKYGSVEQLTFTRGNDPTEITVLAQKKTCTHCNKQKIERV